MVTLLLMVVVAVGVSVNEIAGGSTELVGAALETCTVVVVGGVVEVVVVVEEVELLAAAEEESSALDAEDP